jgi:hypothetical protein
VCTNTPIGSSGYTLLHAAAAWGRRDCTTLLLRNGLLATASSVNGRTPIDLTVVDVPQLPAAVLPSDLSCTVVRCDADIQAVMLLLLQCGAPVDAAMMCSNSKYAAAVKQYTDDVRRELQASNTAHAVRARHTYTDSETHTHTHSNAKRTCGTEPISRARLCLRYGSHQQRRRCRAISACALAAWGTYTPRAGCFFFHRRNVRTDR